MNDIMEIDQNSSKKLTLRRHGDARSNRSATHVGLRSIVGLLPVLLVLAGSGMQGYVNGTIDALFVALLLLLAGIVTVSLVFPGKRSELRAFLLTYGVCVFVGGLAQCYSLATFGNLQSTNDAVNSFFPIISPQPPFTTMYDIPWRLAPTALAVLTWQQVYKLAWVLGFAFGPYIGVMFNAFVMGLTGSITVQTARELFGDDVWRLRRVGTLFAFCGLFILFGSILLRDCFTTFFNSLVLWGLVRWLCRPTSRNMLFAVTLTGISIGAMMFLRSRSIVLFGLFWLLALTCWFLAKRLDFGRILAAMLVMLALLFGSGYLMNYMQISQDLQTRNIEKYTSHMGEEARQDSLGMSLVIRQPLPIRLVMGTGALIVCPIPLWATFRSAASEYHLIKGYHGIYQVFVLPLVLAGFIMAIRISFKNRSRSLALLFLAIYLLINTLAVVATSMESRHIAQFMPAFMVLAAVPDTRDRKIGKYVRHIAIAWFAVVFLVHLAWAIAAMGR